MDIIEYLEEGEEELHEHPDRIINRAYIAYLLHDLPDIVGTGAEQRQNLCDSVAAHCLTLLCPPLAVNVISDALCFLVHLNLDRTVEEVALAAGEVWAEQLGQLGQWAEDYSAVSISGNEAEDIANDIATGESRILALFENPEHEE